jgi:hypothetical protein
MLIARSQDGGSMRSTVKLNLADELHSEFAPTKVTTVRNASAARHRLPKPCAERDVLRASPALLS